MNPKTKPSAPALRRPPHRKPSLAKCALETAREFIYAHTKPTLLNRVARETVLLELRAALGTAK